MNFAEEEKTYYYPAEKLNINFKLNTRDKNKGQMPIKIRIKKIHIPSTGDKIYIYYEYINIDSMLATEYEVKVLLNPAYDGFCMSGGPVMDLGPANAMGWQWWRNGAKPDSITLTPVRGKKGEKTEMSRKSDMLNAWNTAWSGHLMKVWSGTYRNMQVLTTRGPKFSESFKVAAKFPKKAKHVFLFTKFVKEEAAIDYEATDHVPDLEDGEVPDFRMRLKF